MTAPWPMAVSSPVLTMWAHTYLQVPGSRAAMDVALTALRAHRLFILAARCQP